VVRYTKAEEEADTRGQRVVAPREVCEAILLIMWLGGGLFETQWCGLVFLSALTCFLSLFSFFLAFQSNKKN
jgi:hypothetical protein